jgi:hypothetical protein
MLGAGARFNKQRFADDVKLFEVSNINVTCLVYLIMDSEKNGETNVHQ